MWRWLHSLPRAVRQQFHSPGASAGICVEDLHDNDLNKLKREVRVQQPRVYHCRCRNDERQDNGDKTRRNSEDFEYWRLLHGKHSAFEAIGLSGAIALCVELTHFNALGKFHGTENKEGCLLRRLASSIHHLGGTSYCPVNNLNPDESADENSVGNDHQVQDIKPDERNPSDAASADVEFNLSSLNQTTGPLKEERRFDFFEFKSTGQPKKQATDETKTKTNFTDQKQKTDEKLQADASIPVLSIEEAFAEFQTVCNKYTAVAKSIMGHQAALKGNMKSAATLWKEATTFGHTKSYFNLALCHEHGRGVKKDIKEAVRLYQLASEDNHPQAMYNLALILMDGNKHIPQDTKQATTLLTRAAKLGLMEAQKYLGVFYSGDEQEDPEKAAHFMRMAADQNDPEAQCFLAMFYEQGYGVDENTCKAAYLYNRAAEGGDQDAMYSLAMYHLEGLGGYGVDENPCKAAYLYNKAAESGDRDAMYSLALYHLEGLGGLPQDQHCARTLLQKSANLGNKQAQNKLDELDRLNGAQVLTDEEIPLGFKGNTTTQDVSYLLRLNKSVSTPCLSELVRGSFKQVKDKIMYDPVSDIGTVSQIYSQLMVPRGISLVPSISPISDQPETSTGDNSDPDCGIIFRTSSNSHSEDIFETDSNSGDFYRAENQMWDIDHVKVGHKDHCCAELDNQEDYENSHFVHSASMPDMMLVACI